MAIATSREDPMYRGGPRPVLSWRAETAPTLGAFAILRDGSGFAERKQRSCDSSRSYSSNSFEAAFRSMRCGMRATFSGADRSAGGVR